MIRRLFLSTALALGAVSVFGSGFALYEPSTVAHAMGGALVGKAMDASANYINPATLTDLTNIQFTVGFVTEHPRGEVRVWRDQAALGDQSMDPGLFWLPHVQLAVPLPWDFAFGLGFSAEYGLGTRYPESWAMNWNSTETTVQGFVINPNLAYKITDSWSVAVGLRWLYFDFEQYARPQAGAYGTLSNHLKGNNRFGSLGWQIGTKYDITDTISFGVVYKSPIDVTVKGDTATDVLEYDEVAISSASSALAAQSAESIARAYASGAGFVEGSAGYSAVYQAAYAQAYGAATPVANKTIHQTVASAASSRNGAAEADLTLPQSVTFGPNWDVFPTWHLGAAVSWTQWSEFDSLHFALAGGDKDVRLDWRDTWRASVGSCWDFAADWKWLVSYTYDMDCTTSTQSSTMLPPADRHIVATGFAWNCWAGLELALSYSCIFMDGRNMTTSDSLGHSYTLETTRGFCHAAGFSVTYRF